MSKAQAKIFWQALSSEQKIEFNKLMKRLNNKELTIANILVDDNEQLQHITLEPKEKSSIPIDQFGKHFSNDK